MKETPFGEIPENWEVSKIIDITDVVTDYVANGSFKSLAENVNYEDHEDSTVLIRLVDYNNDFQGNFVYVNNHAYDFLAKSKLFGGEIIISNVGANVGTVFRCPFLNKKMTLGPNSIVVKFKGSDDFYYYWLKSPAGQHMLHSIVTGSAQPKFNKTNFRDMLVPVPPQKEQEKIASVLSSLDAKIEENKKINKNLEQQAKTVLNHTLEDCRSSVLVHLGDYLYIKGRIGWKGLKKSEYLDHSDYRIINGESLTSSGIDWNKAGYISKERYEESPEIMLQIGDILLSKDGTIGKIGYVDRLDSPTSIASGIFVIRNTKPDIISTSFIYYLLKSSIFKAFVSGRTEGSVIPHLYQKDLMEFEFPLPSKTDMENFDDLIEPQFKMLLANQVENEYLAKVRDSLLPKLMSGEIDISGIDI